MARREKITIENGQKFGYLVVIRKVYHSIGRKRYDYLCRCTLCNHTLVIQKSNLINNHIQMCRDCYEIGRYKVSKDEIREDIGESTSVL